MCPVFGISLFHVHILGHSLHSAGYRMLLGRLDCHPTSRLKCFHLHLQRALPCACSSHNSRTHPHAQTLCLWTRGCCDSRNPAKARCLLGGCVFDGFDCFFPPRRKQTTALEKQGWQLLAVLTALAVLTVWGWTTPPGPLGDMDKVGKSHAQWDFRAHNQSCAQTKYRISLSPNHARQCPCIRASSIFCIFDSSFFRNLKGHFGQ